VSYKDNYNYRKRNLRYSAFDGKKYEEDDLILLKAVRNKEKAHNKANSADAKNRAAD
jgi:hypothetical protein